MGIRNILKSIFADIKSVRMIFSRPSQSKNNFISKICYVKEEYNRLIINDKTAYLYSLLFNDCKGIVELMTRLDDAKIILKIERLTFKSAYDDLKAQLNSIEEKKVYLSRQGAIEGGFLIQEENEKRHLLSSLVKNGTLFYVYGTLSTSLPIGQNDSSLFKVVSGIQIIQRYFDQIVSYKSFVNFKQNKYGTYNSDIKQLGIEGLLQSPSSDGILLGRTLRSKNPIFIDVFAYENAHVLIVAKSGAGKSFLTRQLIKRWILNGIKVIVFDIELDFNDIAKEYNASSFTSHDWNFVDNIMLENGNMGYFKDLLDLISCKHEELIPYISTLFSSFSAADLISQIDNFPKKIKEIIYKYLFFSYDSKAFQRNDFIYCHVSSPIDLRISFFKLTSYFFMFNEVETMIVIDEAHKLLDDEVLKKQVRNLIKQGRKHKIGLCIISQDILDFTTSDMSKAIIANSSVKILLKQEPIYIPLLRELFDISGEELFIQQLKVGEGLVITPDRRVELFFEGDE